jgi:hypothetical protein
MFSSLQLVFAEPVFPRLAADLDEPRGYCFDLSGYDENINWKNPIQTHTCKHDLTHGDQIIESADITASGGRLYLPVYDICIQAEHAESGAQLMLSHCADEILQQWQFTEKGLLQPMANPDICVTIGTEPTALGTPPGTPQFWHRSLVLDQCDEAIQDLQTWTLQPPKKYMSGPGARMKP